jgi:hypothetical protein
VSLKPFVDDKDSITTIADFEVAVDARCRLGCDDYWVANQLPCYCGCVPFSLASERSAAAIGWQNSKPVAD